MRGLGFNRTLVLINGRRMIGDVNGDGAVDLGAIPMSMVERVEVLKDGASTVYGTDAIAGVVNYVLKTDFEGFEFTVNNGITSESDAENAGFSALMGIGSNNGSMVMAIEHQVQKEMLQGDRAWAHDALYPLLQDNGSFLATASGSSNSRRIRGIPGLAGNFIVDADTGLAREFTPGDVYNYAPVNALVTPNERWQFAVNGTFDFNDSITAFTEALYTRRTSHQRLAPDASFGVTSSYTSLATGLPQWNDLVPAENPFNPFGSVNCQNMIGDDGVTPVCDVDVRLNRRFEESGGRLFRQTDDQFRVVAGLKGDFTDNISWDIAYTYAMNEGISETKNYHRLDRWEIAVTPSLCNANTACAAAGVLNPFAPFGSITDAQLEFLMASSLKNTSTGELEMYQAGLSGETEFEFDGGAVGWAAGFETRSEKGTFTPDEFAAAGLTTGGASDPQSGSFRVDEFYAETALPVLENLTIDLSARSSSYDTSAGDTTIFKIGVDWGITDGIRLRSGYGTGFRAPNISELNQDSTTEFPIMEALCEFSDRRNDLTATQLENCTNLLGDPDLQGADGEYGFAWQSAYTTSAPATPLTPEESTNFTMGLVFDDVFVEGLHASVDYWQIEVDNYIGSPNLNDIFGQCLNTAGLTGSACAAFEDNLPAAGDAFYNTYPNATGNPIDFIFPADGKASFGNLGTVTTDGIDLDAQYTSDIDFIGANKMDLRLGATFVTTYETEYALTGTTDLLGTADGFAVFPELRMNTSVRFTGENWSVAWTSNYIDETIDRFRPANITDDNVAESVWTHDLVGTLSYENYSFIFGINNVTDIDPPRFHSAFNANTEPGMYDVLGRRFFAQAKISF